MKNPMKKYVILTFFLFASVYLTTFNTNPVNAVNTVESFSKNHTNTLSLDSNMITLSLPTACVFDDGDLPKVDPDDCTPISNNEETLGSDNILFTLDSSPELFETFMCTLKDQNGNLISSGECGQSNNIAEDEYNDLADGTYTFTVAASRTITNNNNSADITETAVSPEFNFVVGIESGSMGSSILESLGGVDSALSESQFKKLLLNEKLGFLNLENKLKANEVVNTTSLACSVSDSDSDPIGYLLEFNCDRLLIFTNQVPISNLDSNTSIHNPHYLDDMYIYKVNSALSHGISGSLISCGFVDHEGFSDIDVTKVISIKPISCDKIFVAYELTS
jgi:hypothetical protein